MSTQADRIQRSQFRALAELRIREAKLLLDHRLASGAYDLSGYAVECALKACIAKLTRRFQFPPDKDYVGRCYSHDFEKLLNAANLGGLLEERKRADPRFKLYWSATRVWKEDARYKQWTQVQAQGLYEAITEQESGVLSWIRRHW